VVLGLASSIFGAGDVLAGALSCAEMIAGSTGAPLTVELAAGARRAGGVYLFSRLPDRGGKSCLFTPLYLLKLLASGVRHDLWKQ